MIERNVGGRDRIVRAVVGTGLLVVAVAAFVVGRRSLGLLAGAGSAGLLFNAATQFCGMNALLGIDTCPDE